MNKKIGSFLLVLVMISALVAANVSAATVTITETVNIAAARQNIHGHGYEWANKTSTLTLSGVNINTKSDYGLRLPGECTVILEGDNYIKAEKYAISCSGNVLFKGSGTLTIDAGEYGIYLISQDNTTKVRILSGSYNITAGVYGIYSEYTDFSLSGGELDIKTSADGGRAIMGRVVNLVGGAVRANSPLEATHSLTVDGIDIDVDADSAALVAKKLTVRNVDTDASEEYNGENSIHATAQKRWHSKSIVFGENVGGWADFALIFGVLCAVAACIVIPSVRKKRKKKALYERLVREGYMTEEEANKKSHG